MRQIPVEGTWKSETLLTCTFSQRACTATRLTFSTFTRMYSLAPTASASRSSLTQVPQSLQSHVPLSARPHTLGLLVASISTLGTNSTRARKATFTIATLTQGAGALRATSVGSTRATWRGPVMRATWSETKYI